MAVLHNLYASCRHLTTLRTMQTLATRRGPGSMLWYAISYTSPLTFLQRVSDGLLSTPFPAIICGSVPSTYVLPNQCCMSTIPIYLSMTGGLASGLDVTLNSTGALSDAELNRYAPKTANGNTYCLLTSAVAGSFSVFGYESVSYLNDGSCIDSQIQCRQDGTLVVYQAASGCMGVSQSYTLSSNLLNLIPVLAPGLRANAKMLQITCKCGLIMLYYPYQWAILSSMELTPASISCDPNNLLDNLQSGQQPDPSFQERCRNCGADCICSRLPWRSSRCYMVRFSVLKAPKVHDAPARFCTFSLDCLDRIEDGREKLASAVPYN